MDNNQLNCHVVRSIQNLSKNLTVINLKDFFGFSCMQAYTGNYI